MPRPGGRRVVKQSRWLLLRNPANLKTPEQQIQLKELWMASTAWACRLAWRQGMAHAQQSQIPALMHFARKLRGYWRGIVNRVRWPMHTGQPEGINNKIKVIKRMAYGYRDSGYFS